MSIPLLKTKLFIPSLVTNLVNRPNLLAKMDAGLDKRLSLVAAPAGFGKTTFISNWVRSIEHPVVWVSLDEADNDPVVFWAYVVAGFMRAIPGDNSNLGQITKDQLPPTKTILTHLINSLAENIGKVILVLDDYHLISNPQIHEDFTFLIDNQPPALHIVLLTRADPPLPIARLRGRGLLTEIRADHLRFTVEETRIFLNEMLALDLSDVDIVSLDRRTEGWIIGLQLAAISMQGRDDKSEFIIAFSGGHHFILEYLTEEVIDRLPKLLRNFLIQTAVLERLNAPLCAQVTGIEESATQLTHLLRHNLFIVPLDDEYIWFRYHHLFRDLLKNRLQKDFSTEQINQFYRRASQWFWDENKLEEAVRYALLAQDFKQAAELIEQIAGSTMLHGQLITLLQWIEALPDTCLESHPRLRFYQAWALSLGGQPQVAEKILRTAKSTLGSLPDSPENQALRGELAALLTGILTYYNNPTRVIQEAQEALNYLPEDALISRARVYNALGTAYAYVDQMELGNQNFEQARDLALQAKNPFLATAAIEMLAGIQIYHQGHLHVAKRHLQQALDLGICDDGGYHPFTGTAHILLAEINLERNNLKDAASFLKKGVDLLHQSGIGYSLPHAHCANARLKHALGDSESAIEALQLADQTTQASPLMHILIHNLVCQVRGELIKGDVNTASLWAKGEKCQLPKNLPAYLHEVQQISLAKVCLAQGDTKEALKIIGQIYSQAETGDRMAHIIELSLLKALALHQLGKQEDALESFAKCLSLAEPEGYFRIFLEAGDVVLDLLQNTVARGICAQYANRLLAAFNDQRGEIESLSPQDELIELLTRRELEVLRLMCKGYSNHKIADAMIVSVNTVKKHTSNIYGKLGVRNRAQAMLRAREFGLT